MKTGFQKLIDQFPSSLKVLDVGGGGLNGENTSDFLIEKFANVDFINTKPEAVRTFLERHPYADMVIGNYYTYAFLEKYDLVVLDLNIESNIEDWWNDHKRARELITPIGKIITYIMTTTDYGDDISKQMLERFVTEGKKYLQIEQDSKRNYIQWAILD